MTSIVSLATLGEQDPITSGHMQADKIDSSNNTDNLEVKTS